MNKNEQESLLYTLGFFSILALIFIWALQAAIKILFWAFRFWHTYPDFCYSTLFGYIAMLTSRHAILKSEVTAQWLQSIPWLPLSIGIVVTGLSLYGLRKMRAFHMQRQAKRHISVQNAQAEYYSAEIGGGKVVEVKNLQGCVSPVVNAELKKTGLSKVVREAKKVSWANRIILAKEQPFQVEYGIRLLPDRNIREKAATRSNSRF